MPDLTDKYRYIEYVYGVLIIANNYFADTMCIIMRTIFEI